MRRLLVLDKNEDFFRVIEEGLKRSCDAECFHAKTGAEAKEMLTSHNLTRMLVQGCVRDEDSLGFIRSLRESHPVVVSVAVSDTYRRQHVVAAFRAGAKGFLLKSQTVPELVHHLYGWFMGIVPVAPAVLNELMDHYCRHLRDISEGESYGGAIRNNPIFSKRENDVLRLLVNGASAKEIALKLDLSPTTVQTYIKRIYGKLNVNNRVAAVANVMDRRLIAR